MIIRNRSITGDTVCVQLLDRSEWKGVTRKLPSRDTNDESRDESCDNPRPTGRVVGIYNSSDRDIIASFPVKYTCNHHQWLSLHLECINYSHQYTLNTV